PSRRFATSARSFAARASSASSVRTPGTSSARAKKESVRHGSYRRRRPPPPQASRLLAPVPLRNRARARERDLQEGEHPSDEEDGGADRGRDQAHPRAPRNGVPRRRRPAPRS